jgi:hypothetical protein
MLMHFYTMFLEKIQKVLFSYLCFAPDRYGVPTGFQQTTGDLTEGLFYTSHHYAIVAEEQFYLSPPHWKSL